MENALRPHSVGTTQWYILHQLAHHGPTLQRDLVRTLQIERATMSIVVSALVRKGLVEQVQDNNDQRRKNLRLTDQGAELWSRLPDLSFINRLAFDEVDDDDIATTVRVLRAATNRLNNFSKGKTQI